VAGTVVVHRIRPIRALRTVAIVAVLAMVPLVFYFTTQATWDLLYEDNRGGYNARFFWAQARAVFHGHLDVARSALLSECWERDSLCYGYFGLTPSVLRMPLLPLLRRLSAGMTPLYAAIAVLLAYWVALRLLIRSLQDFGDPAATPRWILAYAIVGAFVLGPGSTLIFLTRPAVYEEAVAWNVAFLLLAIERVWAWRSSRRITPLIVAVISGVLAANARPTGATACFVLGLGVLALWRFGSPPQPDERRGRVIAAALCLSLLPGLTAGGVFWLKFRTPFPNLTLNEQVPESPFWADILRANGNHTRSFIFTPTELVAYFRPDAITWSDEWPYVDFLPPKRTIWMPPLPPGGAYLERETSLTASMPLAWTLNLLVMVWLGRSAWRRIAPARVAAPHVPAPSRELWLLGAASLATAAFATLLTLTTVGLVNRYLNDFFAISVVGVALGHRVVIPILSRRPRLTVIVGIAAGLLVIWSVIAAIALTIRLVFPS